VQKRAIEPERIERMVSAIVRQLESSGDTEVASDKIGETVMMALAGVDTVAYVRFASVYRNFSDASDFETFVQELRPPSGDAGPDALDDT